MQTRTVMTRATVLALVLTAATAQERDASLQSIETAHLGFVPLDGGLVALIGVAPEAGGERFGRAATGLLFLESIRIGQGELRPAENIGKRRVDYGGKGGTPDFYEIAVARKVSDGELVVAQLGGQGPMYLDLWVDGNHLVRTRSIMAPHDAAMFSEDAWLPLSDRSGARTEFSTLGGLALDSDGARLVAYVSGRERRGRTSYVLAVPVDSMEFDVVPDGRIVARGSGPRLSRDEDGNLWMLTRDAMEGFATPAALRLSRRGVDGTWSAVPTPLTQLKASADYDMAVGDGRLYVSAWHYPEYQGGNLSLEEPVELGLWSLDLASGDWSRVTPPGGFDPIGPVQRYSRSVQLFASGGSSSPGLTGPVMAYAMVAGGFAGTHLRDLQRVPLD